MSNFRLTLALTLLTGFTLGAAGMHALAQQGGTQRTLLQKAEIAPTAAMEVVMAATQIGTAGRHTHPGVEIGYVLSGEARMEIEGEPAHNLKAGDSYLIAAGKPHEARITGDAAAKVVVFYVVEKGRPFSSPAL